MMADAGARTWTTRVLWLALSILGCLSPGVAHAWSAHGHRVVCQIARLAMDEDLRAEVDRLASAFNSPLDSSYSDFPAGCVFADDVQIYDDDGCDDGREDDPREQFRVFTRWHYMNVPRSEEEVRVSHCGDDCVLTGIDHHRTRLADSGRSDSERAEALFFLGHWLGDIHQPLHVGYADDVAGNQVTVRGPFYKKGVSFHAVWDRYIIEAAREGRRDRRLAEDLYAEASDEERRAARVRDPLVWAQESYDHTVSSSLGYCEWSGSEEGTRECVSTGSELTLSKDYQDANLPVVERRLRLAGLRLANELEAALRSDTNE